MAAALSAKPTVPIGAPPSPGCDGGAPGPPGSDIGTPAPLDHDIDSPPLLVVGWWHPFVLGDGYVGMAQDAVKIRRLEKQREAERCKIEELKNKSADGQPGLLQFGSSTSEVITVTAARFAFVPSCCSLCVPNCIVEREFFWMSSQEGVEYRRTRFGANCVIAVSLRL